MDTIIAVPLPVLLFAGSCLIAQYLLARWNPECPDPNCKRAHRVHRTQERAAKELDEHRALHTGANTPDPKCPHCKGEP